MDGTTTYPERKNTCHKQLGLDRGPFLYQRWLDVKSYDSEYWNNTDCWWKKSQQPPGMYKTLYIHKGINYQPQLVSQSSSTKSIIKVGTYQKDSESITRPCFFPWEDLGCSSLKSCFSEAKVFFDVAETQKLSNPQDPCMAHLPTFTTQINYM